MPCPLALAPLACSLFILQITSLVSPPHWPAYALPILTSLLTLV